MKATQKRLRLAGVAAAAGLMLAACGGDGGGGDNSAAPLLNVLPAGITNIQGPTTYDGTSDDLLTAGLGKTGIGGAAPGFADAANPTAAELRKRAIYVNYRGIIDPTAAGGYGTLYGPNIDINGNDTLGE
ncbi:MAG TPA: 3-hydroxybutyrate oligomer hydrolase family protein, partial [Thiobacillus sp.]